MCGIFGYLGKRPIIPTLINALYKLEYRGYDSAGIAFIPLDSKQTQIVKTEGAIQNLQKKTDQLNQNIYGIGIAHTRWATHGEVNTKNAHPHQDFSERFSIVHNGVIENYEEIKQLLKIKAPHIQYKSQTDSEIFIHLFSYFHLNNNENIKSTIRQISDFVKGSYSVAILDSQNPELLIGINFGGVLNLVIGNQEFALTSDISASIGISKHFISISDGEFIIIKPSGYQILDFEEIPQNKIVEEITWSLDQIQKGNFEHFMLKEIYEQPQTLENTMRGRINFKNHTVQLGGVKFNKTFLTSISRIKIIACGSSYYTGILGKYWLERIAKIQCDVELASEFGYRQPFLDFNCLYISVSQSGETADTLTAMKLLKKENLPCLNITNGVGSQLARLIGNGIYLHIGLERGVASTKAFTSQALVIFLFTIMLGQYRDHISDEFASQIVEALTHLSSKTQEILDDTSAIEKIALKYKDYPSSIFLGRDLHYPIALEGALKLKEISYIHAEGYPAGEMKHGPLALIDENLPCFFVLSDDSIYKKILANMQELKARKAKIIIISSFSNSEIQDIADDVVIIPKTHYLLQPILSVIPLQLLAYYIGIAKGLDTDKPRNLAKSVTVE